MATEPFNYRNEKLRQVVEFLELHPNQFTYAQLATQFGLTYAEVTSGLHRANKKHLTVRGGKLTPAKRHPEIIPPPPDTKNVMVIGDLHEPFTLEGYRDFCISIARQYKVTHVVFIGDIVDNHAISYHEHDPDGMGAGDELDQAIQNIGLWYKAFPKANVIIGNHDRLIMRKAFTGGIPKRWIMDYKDVLGTPGWSFMEETFYDGVHYIHGEGGTARLRCKKDLVSTVQGHLHPQAYTEWFVGQHYRIFAMQVGCGVDRKSYAMAYAKSHPKPAIGIGLILNHGELAFNVLMKL